MRAALALFVAAMLLMASLKPANASDYPEEHLFYRDDAGDIQHISWARGKFSEPDQWNIAVSAPKAVGNPAVMTVGPEQHLFYRDGLGDIQHIFWVGGKFSKPDHWNVAANAPKAAGDPAVMIVGPEQHLFYRDGTGNIQHIWWKHEFRKPDQWNTAAHASKAAGDPAVMMLVVSPPSHRDPGFGSGPAGCVPVDSPPCQRYRNPGSP